MKTKEYTIELSSDGMANLNHEKLTFSQYGGLSGAGTWYCDVTERQLKAFLKLNKCTLDTNDENMFIVDDDPSFGIWGLVQWNT